MTSKKLYPSALIPAALLGALLLIPAAGFGSEKNETGESLWGEWQPMAAGYAARRRQPQKINSSLSQRRPADVQQREVKQRRLEARSGEDSTRTAALRSVASASTAPGSSISTSSSATTRISAAWLHTTGEGLFEVSVDSLSSQLGRPANAVRHALGRGALRVTRGDNGGNSANKPVSWYHDAASDSLLFAAPGYDTFHTEHDAFRIRLGGAGSKQAQPMSVTAEESHGDSAVGSPFRDTLLFEEEPDMMFLTWVVANEPDADYWFWDYLYAGSRESLSLQLRAPDPAAEGTAELRVLLRGFTDLDIVDEHNVRAVLNGQAVGSVVFEGMNAGLLTASFDQSLLDASGDNTLELLIDYAPGTNPGQFLDEISLHYNRLPVARDDKLWIHAAEGGVQSVSGFSSEDIVVIEAPAGAAILRRDLDISTGANGDWQVSFAADAGVEFLVSTRAAAGTGTLLPDYASNLIKTDNSADYLIIAPRDFAGTAQSLADYRSARFSNVRIAWLDDIFDEFNAGRAEPVALKRFMRRVVGRWQLKPSVVVLVGKGSLDFKDRMGYSDGFLPIALTDTPYSLAVSESRLLGYEDNPPFAIGRLPIVNDAEGMAYVNKLAAHEAASSISAPRALLVADNPDSGGDFPANNQASATHLLNDLGFASAEQLVHPADDISGDLARSDSWNRALVIYDGHGSVAQAGDARENFLLAGQVSSLSNSVLPVFSALTCAVGDHSYPATRSLAGALVLNPGGGAIASLAPSGLSLDAQAQLIGTAFIDNLYLNNATVGDALRDARLTTSGAVQPFVSRMYGIIGEPAVATD